MRVHAPATTWLQRGVLAALGTTLVVAGLQATGSAVATVQVADGTAWLTNSPRGTLVQVSSASEAATATVGVSTPGDNLVARQDGHSALVLNRSTGEIGKVDGALLRYTPQESVPGSSADLQLVAGGERAYVLDASQGHVRTYDSSDLSLVKDVPLAPGPTTAVVDSHGTLFAVNRVSGQVTVVNADGTSSRQTAGGPGSTVTLARDQPYVVDPSAAKVVALDPDGGKPGRRYCLDGVDGQQVLAAGSGTADGRAAVFTITPSAGRLTTTDLESGKCATLNLNDDDDEAGDTADSMSDYGAPVARGDLLFVPVLAHGSVLVVDAADNQIIRTIDNTEMFANQAGGGDGGTIPPFELVLDDGNVWFNSLSGPEAGVLDRAGVTLRVLKYEPAEGTSANEGNGLGVSDDDAALGIDLDPNRGTAREDGNDDDETSRRDDEGDPAGAGGDGTGSSAAALSEPLGSDAQPARLTVLPPGLPGNRSDSQAPAEVVVGADSRPSTPSNPSSPLAPAAPSPPRSPDQQPVPKPPASSLVATFSFGPSAVAVGAPVSFTDRSSGNPPPGTWLWDFGDNTGASVANPTHAYRSPGTYLVTLKVGNGQTTATSLPATVKVSDPTAPVAPAANFDFEPRTAEVGQAVRFSDASVGRVTDWTWDWGDGTQSSGADQTHTWATPNTYRVTLTVRNQYGADTATKSIAIVAKVEPPKALFEFSPKPVAGSPVQFTDLSSGGPSSWTWDFGDGSGSVAKSPPHQFSEAKTYTVKLTVRNAKGTSEVSLPVQVGPAAVKPQARMTVSDRSVEVNGKVRFTSDGTTGNPTSLTWTIGRGPAGPLVVTGSSVEHSWPDPANYPVTLTARNAVGEDSVTVTIAVTRPVQRLKAEFSVRPGRNSQDAALPGQPVQFIDASEGRPTTYTWDWGDGTMPLSSAVASPTHIYSRVGIYNARLTVSSPGVASDAVTHQVYVSGPADPPVADFTASPAAPRVGETVTFTDASRNTTAQTTWRWDFGDGSGSTDKSPTHVYTRVGPSTVTLTVDNRNGQTATKTLVVTVGDRAPAPAASFTITPVEPDKRVTGTSLTFLDTTPGNVTTPIFTFPTGSQSPAPGGRSVPYAFAQPGDYSVSMKVCLTADPTNCATVSQALTIRPAETAPTVNVDISGLIDKSTFTGAVGQKVTFSATTTGNPTSTEWMIGSDKQTGPGPVDFTATTPGDLAWSVTVTNGAGSASAKGQLRFVEAKAPTALFASAAKVSVGASTQFTDQTTGYVESWSWSVDGQTVSDKQSPELVFSRVGTYSVKLTATNDWGPSSATKDIVVTVTPQIVVPPTIPVDTSGTTKRIEVRKGVAVNLAAGPTNVGVTGWEWDFGDGKSSTEQAPVKTYDSTGEYTVVLTAKFTGSQPSDRDVLIVKVT